MEALSVSVGRVLGVVKEVVYFDSIMIERWVYDILCQHAQDSNALKVGCEICGFRDDLELHHIAGRKHDYRTITVCGECHRRLSNRQKLWDKRWEKENQPAIVRDAFQLQGIYDALKLRTEKTGNNLYSIIADSLIEDISKRLRGDSH